MRSRPISVQPSGPRKIGAVGADANASTTADTLRLSPPARAFARARRRCPVPRATASVVACTENDASALATAEHHAVERMRRDADARPSSRATDISEPAGLSREPPVELRAADSAAVAPGIVQQAQVVLPLLRLVRRPARSRTTYLVDVPSAALKSRRACVPVTVSFTEIRSHAPASTSSNVRGEYGSML